MTVSLIRETTWRKKLKDVMAVSQIHENHWYNERSKVVMTVSHIHETTQRKNPEKIKTVSLIHESSKWKGDQGRDVTDFKNKNKLVWPWNATLKFYSADKIYQNAGEGFRGSHRRGFARESSITLLLPLDRRAEEKRTSFESELEAYNSREVELQLLRG